ncbi:MAG: class II aldolase/adducin family protein, partial [Chloroflexota bacterium]
MDELSALKLKVARVCRLFHMAGLFDFSGHVSARIPGTDRILIHPRHTARPQVKAADILTVDLSGEVVGGKEQSPSETPIHTCIYRTRPDVLAVAHIHSHYATLLGISGQEFVPVTTSGVMFT